MFCAGLTDRCQHSFSDGGWLSGDPMSKKHVQKVENLIFKHQYSKNIGELYILFTLLCV